MFRFEDGCGEITGIGTSRECDLRDIAFAMGSRSGEQHNSSIIYLNEKNNVITTGCWFCKLYGLRHRTYPNLISEIGTGCDWVYAWFECFCHAVSKCPATT